jgi:hypothetical protein
VWRCDDQSLRKFPASTINRCDPRADQNQDRK